MNAHQYESPAERADKALALAVLTGLMGAAAAGLGISAAGMENLSWLAAAVTPGMLSFLLSYLLYLSAVNAGNAALPMAAAPLALLPAHTETARLPDTAPASGYRPESAGNGTAAPADQAG